MINYLSISKNLLKNSVKLTGYAGVEFLRTLEATRRHIVGQLNGYKNRFSEEDKKLLKKKKISKYFANKVSNDFSAKEIVEYFSTKKNIFVSPYRNVLEDVRKYDVYAKDFSLKEAKELFIGWKKYVKSPQFVRHPRVSVDPEFASKLQKRFSTKEIVKLYACVYDYVIPDSLRYAPFFYGESENDKYGLAAEFILDFPEKYSGKDIDRFFRNELTVTDVVSYPAEYSGLEINLLSNLGIQHDSPLHDTKKEILKYAINNVTENAKEYLSKTFLASGNEGIIIIDSFNNPKNRSENAYKIGRDLKTESKILRKIHSEQPDCKRIIKVTGPLRSGEFDILQLEYIKTLPFFLEDLTDEEVIQNIYELVEGVYEMRVSDVYHQDLHEGNSLRKEDKSLIITDFNSATLTPENEKARNRKYSNNDLIAAGLLGYKIAFGYNLFNELYDQSNVSMMKNKIQHERVVSYADPMLMHKKYEEIQENLGRDLAEPIIYLLNRDLYTQPELPEVENALRFVEKLV